MTKKPSTYVVSVVLVAVLALIYFFSAASFWKRGSFEGVERDSHRKNILVILADDFGLDASPCHRDIGEKKPSMPHLEALCEAGSVLDEMWAAPTCTPTRAAIMTGQYGFKTGVLQVDDVLKEQGTVFDLAKNSGYSNAVIGKWHVSGKRASSDAPHNYGVEHYVGFLSGGLKDYFSFSSIKNGHEESIEEYSTRYFTNEAIEWLAKRDDAEKWLLWLAYNAPHTPFHVPPSDLHTNERLTENSSDQEKYFAALEALDAEMGRLLSHIDLSQTVIIFMGDNGTPGKVVQKPFSKRQAKGSLFQGGVSVPAVITNYAVDAERKASTVDLLPTMAEIMGAEVSAEVDGTALSESQSFLFMDARNRDGDFEYTVKKDDYKYIHSGEKGVLYDLRDAYGESSENTVLDASREKDLREIYESLQ